MKRRAFGVWSLAAALAPERLLALEAAVPAASATASVGAADTLHKRRVTLSLRVGNPGGFALGPQSIWLYVPASRSPTQRLISVDATMAHELQTDALGHTVLGLHWERMPAYFNAVVNIAAWLDVEDQPRSEALDSAQSWLKAERYIEADDPKVLELAERLRRTSDRDTARAIFEWVGANMNYAGYVAEDLGAAYAARARTGDCTEYADLTVALARALGIPSRMVGGHVTDRDATLPARTYHNWAELYLDGAWRLVDAEKRNYFSPAADYLAFRYYRDTATNPVGTAHRFQVQGQMTAQLQ